MRRFVRLGAVSSVHRDIVSLEDRNAGSSRLTDTGSFANVNREIGLRPVQQFLVF